MSKWPMRGHFRYLRFKTFPMTPRTPQCEVFWALLLSSKHSGVPEDSKSPTLGVLGFTPTLGQSGVAIISHFQNDAHRMVQNKPRIESCMKPYVRSIPSTMGVESKVKAMDNAQERLRHWSHVLCTLDIE
jgi:hypothetical protein